MGLVVKAPAECYKEFGADLDGCSTQSSEGCGRCNLAIKYEEKAPCGKPDCRKCDSYPCNEHFNTHR